MNAAIKIIEISVKKEKALGNKVKIIITKKIKKRNQAKPSQVSI